MKDESNFFQVVENHNGDIFWNVSEVKMLGVSEMMMKIMILTKTFRMV